MDDPSPFTAVARSALEHAAVEDDIPLPPQVLQLLSDLVAEATQLSLFAPTTA